MSAPTHCTVHNCTGHSEAQCWRSALDPDDFTQCEMRPALVLLRDEEGNWSPHAIAHLSVAIKQWSKGRDVSFAISDALDALAAASDV